jgi:hypothetical protein
VGRRLATPLPIPSVDPPVRIVLARAGIDAAVVPVGVATDGQMELPADPDVIGWYRYGSAPGDGSGSVVLGGHVDSQEYGIGQFAGLLEAGIGDELEVFTAAGSVSTYRVTDVLSVPKAALPVAELFRRDGHERVVLLTCGGDFDVAAGGYRDNVVVTAAPA